MSQRRRGLGPPPLPFAPNPPLASPRTMAGLRWLWRRMTFGRVLVLVFLLAMLGLYGLDWQGWASTATLLLFIFGPFLVLRLMGRAFDPLFYANRRPHRRRSTH